MTSQNWQKNFLFFLFSTILPILICTPYIAFYHIRYPSSLSSVFIMLTISTISYPLVHHPFPCLHHHPLTLALVIILFLFSSSSSVSFPSSPSSCCSSPPPPLSPPASKALPPKVRQRVPSGIGSVDKRFGGAWRLQCCAARSPGESGSRRSGVVVVLWCGVARPPPSLGSDSFITAFYST